MLKVISIKTASAHSDKDHASPPPGSASLQNDETDSKASIDLWIVIFYEKEIVILPV